MAHSPEDLTETKKQLESKFLRVMKEDLDMFGVSPKDQQKMATKVVDAAEQNAKKTKGSLTYYFNKQLKTEQETIQKLKDKLGIEEGSKPKDASPPAKAAPRSRTPAMSS